jgi:hypothetical protein
LAEKGIDVSEAELLDKVEVEYGKHFTNLWNPTIAKLACQYGLDVTMYADWPLFKPELLKQAMAEFGADPEAMDIRRYENLQDSDQLTEPLPLAYREMFEAIKLGCQTIYGRLTAELLTELLAKNSLVQTSIKIERLYPGEPSGFHSILIYSLKNGKIEYHDPARQPSMKCSLETLISAANGTGACLAFNLTSAPQKS